MSLQIRYAIYKSSSSKLLIDHLLFSTANPAYQSRIFKHNATLLLNWRVVCIQKQLAKCWH
jgi:hypothetical protein